MFERACTGLGHWYREEEKWVIILDIQVSGLGNLGGSVKHTGVGLGEDTSSAFPEPHMSVFFKHKRFHRQSVMIDCFSPCASITL